MKKKSKIVIYGSVLSFLIAASLFVYTVYASNMLSYLSNDPKACINCHVMNTAYATWDKSSHKNVASCADCHLPAGSFLAKYKAKSIDGWNHSVAFSTNSYSQNLQITDSGAQRVQANCVRCHASVNATLKMNADKYHSIEFKSLQNGLKSLENGAKGLENGRKCVSCHQYVPHGKVNSIISTPYSLGVKERNKEGE